MGEGVPIGLSRGFRWVRGGHSKAHMSGMKIWESLAPHGLSSGQFRKAAEP